MDLWDDYYQKKEKERLQFAMAMSAITVALLLAFLLMALNASAQVIQPADYSTPDDRIVAAIYKAEGGAKAKKPFGILSVECNSYEECRQICLNTVRNNKKRYAEYGHKTHDSFIEFLASRYAPIGAGNDPRNLNKNWVKNVRAFL